MTYSRYGCTTTDTQTDLAANLPFVSIPLNGGLVVSDQVPKGARSLI